MPLLDGHLLELDVGGVVLARVDVVGGDVVSGDVDNLSSSAFNFLKFTTAVDGETSVDDLFDELFSTPVHFAWKTPCQPVQ